MGVRIDELENSIGELMAQVRPRPFCRLSLLAPRSSPERLLRAPPSQAGIDEDPMTEGAAPPPGGQVSTVSS